MNNLISILIPVYNRSNIVLETLVSIQKQTYKNWECIIVDDQSTDNTIEVISNFIYLDKRFKLLLRPNNFIKGANSCRNYALSKSKGSFIQFFDSDDLMDFNLLELKIKKFIEFPKTNAVLSGFKVFKNNNWKTNSKWNFNKKDNLFKEFLLKEIVFNTATFLWKREFIGALKFNEHLTRAQDLDFIFRILNNNKNNFEVIEKELTYVRLHKNTITNNYNTGKIEDIDSEVLVRRNILENNFLKEDVKVQNKLTFFYLNTIKKYLVNNHYKSYFKSLFWIKNRFFKIRLFYIGIIYLVAKKGLTKYSKIIKTLK